MKRKITPLVVAIVLSLIPFCSFAQNGRTATPQWVSDRGYWIVESNLHSPKNSIIWFYNNDNLLIYKETITGQKLNPAKRKTKMKLKRALETSLTAWEEKKKPVEEGNLVKMMLK